MGNLNIFSFVPNRYVYIVIENGISYSNGYINYNSAINAVKEKYVDWDSDEINEVDVSEGHKIYNKKNIDPNKTELYIEKQIYITIYKLPIIE
jgi:hypothetical protein